MTTQNTEAYLLGLSISALDAVQGHLIQNEPKQALSVINEALRMLHINIDKHFYNQAPQGEAANG